MLKYVQYAESQENRIFLASLVSVAIQLEGTFGCVIVIETTERPPTAWRILPGTPCMLTSRQQPSPEEPVPFVGFKQL